MCWTSFNLYKKIAEEDITTVKVVKAKNGRMFSYYSYNIFEYILDKLYPKIEIKPDKRKTFILKQGCFYDLYEIHKGYHSYIPKYCIYPSDYIAICSDRYYFRPHEADIKLLLVECIIPKGTIYYLNSSGEYVSEQIILKNVLDVI